MKTNGAGKPHEKEGAKIALKKWGEGAVREPVVKGRKRLIV
jgi:hypothetical protein